MKEISKQIAKVIFCKSIPRESLCQAKHPLSKRSESRANIVTRIMNKISAAIAISGIIPAEYDRRSLSSYKKFYLF